MTTKRVTINYIDYVAAQGPDESENQTGVLECYNSSETATLTVGDKVYYFTWPELGALIAAATKDEKDGTD